MRRFLAAISGLVSIFSAIELARMLMERAVKRRLANEVGAWLRGYMAGNEEFAKQLKENDPELYDELQSGRA